MRYSTLALAIAGTLASAGIVQAHPALKVTAPVSNGIVGPALKEIRLSFSEPIIPAFSGVDVTDGKGGAVQTGKPFTDAKSKNVLVVPLKATLRAGRYQAAWHAVAADTHRVQGKYSFRVK
jgi:methionine-rich copper-binding protein CopC